MRKHRYQTKISSKSSVHRLIIFLHVFMCTYTLRNAAYIWVINGCIIAAFVVFGGAAFIDAKWIRINHYFNIHGIVRARFEVLDVASDVLFAVHLMDRYFYDETLELLVAMIAAFTFIALPITTSLVQVLGENRREWRTKRVRVWVERHSRLLFLSSILSGSAFVAVSMANCNAFQLKIFSMGLTPKEMLKFRMKRMWSIVFCEVN